MERQITLFKKKKSPRDSWHFWFLLAWRLVTSYLRLWLYSLLSFNTSARVQPKARSKHLHTYTHMHIGTFLEIKSCQGFYTVMMPYQWRVRSFSTDQRSHRIVRRHLAEPDRKMCFRYGCTSLFVDSGQASQGGGVLGKKKESEGLWLESSSSRGLKQLQTVAQSSVMLAKLFMTLSNGNAMKSMPVLRVWNHSAVVVWPLPRKRFGVLSWPKKRKKTYKTGRTGSSFLWWAYFICLTLHPMTKPLLPPPHFLHQFLIMSFFTHV